MENGGEEGGAQGQRLIDRFDPRVIGVLTILGFAIPILAYLWFVHRFALDAIFEDQWDDVTVVKGSYVHFFDWGAMWAPHGDNRIFFPNIVVVLLAHTVHLDVRVEEWLSAAMLLGTTALVIMAHRRRSPSTPWLYYCPVVFMMLSWVQFQNSVWGFQLGWYLVLLCLALCIYLLDRPDLTLAFFIGALVAAVIGSFSSLQGLLIWPVGLAILYFRRRRPWHLGLWIGVGGASTVVYFYHLGASTEVGFVGDHPLEAVRFYLVTIGDMLGQAVPTGASVGATAPLELFGLLVVLLAVTALIISGLRGEESRASSAGIALIWFGLLFGVLVTLGRAYLGIVAASQSRYTSFTLIILAGIYLVMLGRTPRRLRAKKTLWSFHDQIALRIARIVVLLAIALQISVGFPDGYNHEIPNYAIFAKAAIVLRHIDHASNYEIAYDLCYYESAASIRLRAHFLEVHHLSVFADQ